MKSSTMQLIAPTGRFAHALVAVGELGDPEVGDLCESYADPDTSGPVLRVGDDSVWVMADDGELELHHDDCYIVDRPSLSTLWERHQRKDTPDGVAWVDRMAPELQERLQHEVDRLMTGPADYHPGSGGVVRDLIHPSLYPHVCEADAAPEDPAGDHEEAGADLPTEAAQTSGSLGARLLGRLRETLGFEAAAADKPPRAPEPTTPAPTDVWGRPYERSKYQWLPSTVTVDEDGVASFTAPINNLPRAENEALYSGLGALFSEMLPLFEGVYGYSQRIRFHHEAEAEHELPETRFNSAGPKLDWSTVEPTPLRGRTLQVIPKIVEYRLKGGQRYEGVWHVEGMSHEHIVATGVCILDRDPALKGGALRFKRPYTDEEAGLLFWNIAQCRPQIIEEMVEEGVVPIGSLKTPKGRLMVFPNSHIHKLNKITLAKGAPDATRRVIVFWLVDPEQRIVSTSDVPPAAERMSHDEALAARLELMEERRVHKQSHNVRAVSLCEH
jgi:hypothetical protein